ncbi:MAG: hypothetical protein QXW39_06245 [Candidatus Bathyarchaeia archaeon]
MDEDEGFDSMSISAKHFGRDLAIDVASVFSLSLGFTSVLFGIPVLSLGLGFFGLGIGTKALGLLWDIKDKLYFR